MKTCPYCLKEVSEDHVKCPFCGGWFTDDADQRQRVLDQERKSEQVLKLVGSKDDAPGHEDRFLYYEVPSSRILWMTVLTYGFYPLYWFYRNWQTIKQNSGERISPFWRAFFAIFFCYPLFKRIQQNAKAPGSRITVGAGPLAIAYIASMVLGGEAPFFISLGLLILSALVLVRANRMAIVHNRSIAPNEEPAAPLSRFEVGMIVVMVLILLAFFIPFVVMMPVVGRIAP
ncbi:MAG: hypothetical protein ACLFPX_04415 [Candidatus Omnitrophota bacterium]